MNKTGPKKSRLRIGVTAATLAGSAIFASGPAAADQFGVSINVGAVGFSYNSGGYCDDYGCPDRFWDYPVYYCPVYYRHRWYRGPVYYTRHHGGTYYWVRNGWRRDEWGGPRPPWACNDRYGPALDLYFYQSNGFRVRDAWWNSWGREHNDWYWRDHPDWNRNQNFGGRITQGQEWDRARTWTGVSHPWASARGQGFEQGGQRSGAMGVNPSQSSGAGSQGGDQGARHRGAGAGGQGPDQGTQYQGTGGASPVGGPDTQHRGAGGGTPPSSSMIPSGGQGNQQPSNMTGSGATQSPQNLGGPDQSNRHHGKPSDASTGNQGNAGNAGGGGSGSGRGRDNQNSGQSQGAPDNSGNDKSAGKKHGDHGGDQNNPGDNGSGNPH